METRPVVGIVAKRRLFLIFIQISGTILKKLNQKYGCTTTSRFVIFDVKLEITIVQREISKR